ncbi:YqeB family protein [Actinomadura scrupuli]|uniref:YqeB family protein n=1 Tax=Actinomadura scrupuli TaxID=559629 RepID=UPI003D968880
MESEKYEGATFVAAPPWALPLVWVGFPPLGAGAGWLLKAVAGWVAALRWAPFRGPFKLVDSIPEPQVTIAALILGGLAGLALAHQVAKENLTVTVSAEQVALARGGSVRAITRASVSAVFLDGKLLVLLGQATEELAREPVDLSADRLRDAFLAHGFPWRKDGDPYEDDYRQWVEETAGLPPGAAALLKARARALARGDKDDAADLRAELARLGIVLRDQRKHQYWRRAGRPPADPGG